MFLSVGFFAIFWVFGNVDYATVFSVAPFINESAITIVGLLLLIGAMRKSAQIGLHTWLPDAMEGQNYIIIILVRIMLTFIPGYEIILQCSRLPVFMNQLSVSTLHAMTGNMLGDGSIGFSGRNRGKKPTGNARYKMGISIKSEDYLENLRYTVYMQYGRKCLTY